MRLQSLICIGPGLVGFGVVLVAFGVVLVNFGVVLVGFGVVLVGFGVVLVGFGEYWLVPIFSSCDIIRWGCDIFAGVVINYKRRCVTFEVVPAQLVLFDILYPVTTLEFVLFCVAESDELACPLELIKERPHRIGIRYRGIHHIAYEFSRLELPSNRGFHLRQNRCCLNLCLCLRLHFCLRGTSEDAAVREGARSINASGLLPHLSVRSFLLSERRICPPSHIHWPYHYHGLPQYTALDATISKSSITSFQCIHQI